VTDIFNFWSELSPGPGRVHPADRIILERIQHGFDLDCLAGAFMGRLRNAPVVLLFLSPGLDDCDKAHAESLAVQQYYARQRTGNTDLPTPQEHQSAYRWANAIIRQFNLAYVEAASKIAFLNIGPYKSREFHDRHLLAALPSCRVSLSWAQEVLFPQAEAGEKVVVCLRSPERWGLRKGESYGKTLYAPDCNRRGFMLHGPMRERIVLAVQNAVRR